MTESFRELVRVYVTNEALHNWLKSQPEMSAFIVQTLQDLKDGKLVYPQNSVDVKIKEARLENLGYKNRIDRVKALHWEIFDKEPSPQATTAIKQSASYPQPESKPADTILQPDGTMRCVTCGKFIPARSYGFEQANDYESHVARMHSRKLFEGERKLCLELCTTT